jgi:hypothetical protein
MFERIYGARSPPFDEADEDEENNFCRRRLGILANVQEKGSSTLKSF